MEAAAVLETLAFCFFSGLAISFGLLFGYQVFSAVRSIFKQ